MGDAAPAVSADLSLPKQRSSRYTTYIFIVMFAINFLNYMDRYIFTGAANTIGKELGLGLDQLGYIASAFLIIYTLGTLPFGVWADRAKRKNVVAVCVAIWSLATAFTALAGNFTTIFLSRMALGVGEAGYYPAGTALLSDCYNRQKRARIMSLWTAGSLIGLLAGFVIGGVVAALGFGKWRLAFLITGIPGLILAFLAWRLREPRHNQADDELRALEAQNYEGDTRSELMDSPQAGMAVAERVGEQAEQRSIWLRSRALVVQVWHDCLRLLRIRSLVVLIVMQVFAFYAQGASVTFLPIYLQQHDTLDLSPALAATLAGGVVVVAGIIGLFLGSSLADLLNRRYPGARVLVGGIGFLLCAPCYALTVIVHNYVAFIVFFFITAMLIQMYSGPSTAATQDVVPSVLRASAVAISLLLAHLLGDAFAPSIIGVLANALDPTHGQHFANGIAGQDLSLAFLFTSVPTLVIAGLVGIFGARWVRGDIEAAEHADLLIRQAQVE